MNKAPSAFLAERFNDRSLIESIVSSFYIIDYGFIKTVNPDKTINVSHAKRLKTLQGESLPPTVTNNVEVLTVSGRGFSINFDYAKGDKVLLLGLKDYVPKVKDVNSSTETENYIHYNRNTIKAIPLCVFDDSAKVTINIEQGKMEAKAQTSITLDSPNTKLTGGMVEIGGTVAPTGSGAFCGIPYCLFTGAPQCGSQSSGT